MSVHPAKSPLKPGALLAGKYRLLKLLGRGAAGAVWSATNTATSRKVALKFLLRPDPKQVQRLLREARAAGALHHPNVIDIYDVTEVDGSPVLVLELLEGDTLQHLIDERAPLSWTEAAGIGRDVARALATAHASGIIHRDLKPANIFLHQPGDDPPVVKVVDFGISKNLLAGEGTLTETGMAVGSPAFMSPEQVRGERDIDGRTDLWALGVILYEMLSGKRLFDGRTHEVLGQVLLEPIKSIADRSPGMDPALARVVHGLLERDKDKRLGPADDVAERLAAIAQLADGPSTSRTNSPPASAGEAHDTTVTRLQMNETNNPVPKAYEDEEEEESTHVAPFAMRALARQTAVPSVYDDEEEEEEEEATRVAPDAILTAAIRASKEKELDQNRIDTVRPPPPTADVEDEDDATVAEPPPSIPTLRPPPEERMDAEDPVDFNALIEPEKSGAPVLSSGVDAAAAAGKGLAAVLATVEAPPANKKPGSEKPGSEKPEPAEGASSAKDASKDASPASGPASAKEAPDEKKKAPAPVVVAKETAPEAKEEPQNSSAMLGLILLVLVVAAVALALAFMK